MLLLNRISELYTQHRDINTATPESRKLYMALYEAIKLGILNFDLPKNTDLPPTRLLAKQLNLSRSTVIKSYEILRLEGYIQAKPGAGHTIISQNEAKPINQFPDLENHKYPDLSEIGKAYLSNVNLINSTDDKSVAFRPGLPPLDIFPVSQWKNLSNLYWRNIKLSGLSYSPSAGNEQLKTTIANYLNLSRNIKCSPQQVFIVSGSLQSLYLIGNILLNAADAVGIENPTFPNVHSIFKGLRAKICPFEIDNEGFVINENYRNLKLLHITPSCHYPTGIKMSERRKIDIINWADRNGTLIIENDYEHELTAWRSKEKSVFTLDQTNRTIYISTFNRLLHPSLRIGFMVVPPFLINPVEALLKHSHRFVAPSIQIVLNQFIEKKYLHNHMKHLWEITEKRKVVFMDEFTRLFGMQVPIQETNTKSLQLLAHLPSSVNDKKLVEYLAKHHLIAHSYSKCFIEEQKIQGLILGYSSVHTPAIKRKIGQMHQWYKQFKS